MFGIVAQGEFGNEIDSLTHKHQNVDIPAVTEINPSKMEDKMVGTEGARTDKIGAAVQTIAFIGNDAQRAQAVPGLRNALLRLLRGAEIRSSVRVSLSFPKPNEQLSTGLVVRRPLDDGIECSWSHSENGRATRLIAKIFMPQGLADSKNFFSKLIEAQKNLLQEIAPETLFSELQKRGEITTSGLVKYTVMSAVLFEAFSLNAADTKAYLHKLVNTGDLIDTEREMYRLGEAWSRFKPARIDAANDSSSGNEKPETPAPPIPAEDNRSLSEQIAEYREKHDLTAVAFAILAKVSVASLKKVIEAPDDVRESTVQKIKHVLKTAPKEESQETAVFDSTTEKLIDFVIRQVSELRQVDDLIANIIARMKMLPEEQREMAKKLLRSHLKSLDENERLKELLELRDWFKNDTKSR